MARLFGTDGVRGQANQPPMDSETVMRLGRAAAYVFSKKNSKNRVLIGKDTRLSGYMLETALESGFASMGVDTYLVGPLPTPGVAYMTRSMRANAGVMISASHNPFEDNGIKFFGADGFKLPDEVEDEIERLMQPGELDGKRAAPERIGKARRIDDALGRYTVYLKSCVERECSFEGIKIVVDAANGAAYKVAPLLFTELGFDVVMLGDRPDGKNINRGCGSLHPEAMAQAVRDHHAVCGIAFDGDADRVIFCDEQGTVLDGDTLLAATALDFRSRGLLRGDGVVGTVMSNLGLERLFQKNGLKLYRSDVGDRYVLAQMLERQLNVGGEQSGHLIFLDFNTTGDGLLSALMVLSQMVRTGKPLSSLSTLVERIPQVLVNIAVGRKTPFEEVPSIARAIKDAEQRLANSGRVLVRYSGTESKARVMIECDDELQCTSIANELADVIRGELGG